jgi:isopenicillin N synthase-like dioxygenase
MSIPVLDASALSEGTAEQREEFATKLLDSLKTYGFAKLVNHTVPVPLVKETFDQVKCPHSLIRKKEN